MVFSITSRSQINLVPNGGFDTLTQCPNQGSAITLAAPWFSTNTFLENSVDLFNRCATAQNLTVPWIFPATYQQPQNGNGFIGMYCYAKDTQALVEHEFAETRLMDSLRKGRRYYAYFHTNPSYDTNSLLARAFIANMGMAFSKDRDNDYEIGGNLFTRLKPVIEHQEIIDDTSSWTLVDGCFKATGNEQYLIIGNFRSNRETLARSSGTSYNPRSYMYVDDVGVYEFDPLPDTLLLCNTNGLRINARFLNGTYHWSTGSTDSAIWVNQPGKYWVEVTMGSCVMADSVTVIDPDLIPSTSEFEVCEGGKPVVLQAPFSGITYLWSNGDNDNRLTVNLPGTYVLNIGTEGCGVYSFTYQVNSGACDCKLFIPTAFTPNGDGRNDFIKILSYCTYNYTIKRFRIVNRWGQTVFVAYQDKDFLWDGTFKGQPAEMGTYFWVLEYEIFGDSSREIRTESGDLTLIR